MAQGNLVKASSVLVNLSMVTIYRRWLMVGLMVVLLVSPGCVRTASTGGGRPTLAQGAVAPSQPASTATPAGPSAAASSPSPLPASGSGPTPPQAIAGTPTPAASQPTGVPAEISQTLAIFPLVEGSTWVYTDEAYSGNEKAVWRVVDTITINLVRAQVFAARDQRDVTLLSGHPSAQFAHPPVNAVFWYLVKGSAIYRQDVDQAAALAWDGLDRLTLEFVLPLAAQAPCWFPDPTQRLAAPAVGAPGCRSAGAGSSVKFPAGTLDNCHQVVTQAEDGTEKLTFCDGVGIADRSFDHKGSPYGEHFVLAGYLVQGP